MGKKRTILFLALILVLTTGYAKAEEASQEAVFDKKAADTLNIEEFKSELQNVANKPTVLRAEVKTLSDRYVVSPGDAISVAVFGEPDLSQEGIVVKSDGYATINPFGEIKVSNLNIDEVNALLTSEYKKYMVNPKVAVKINDLHQAQIYIYGAVQKPGLYQKTPIAAQNPMVLDRNMPLTLANVIASAGGIKYDADIENVQVINTRTGEAKKYNLLSLIKHGDASQDVYLNSEDKVYVPVRNSDAQIADADFLLISSSSIAPADFPVRVIGAVTKPGIQSLTSRSPRINSAIAASEGYTIDANTKALQVRRLTPRGNISTIIVDPNKNDIVLRPDDLIQVTDKRTTVAGRSVGFFGAIFDSVGRFGSAYNEWADMFEPTRRYNYLRD
jgi:protein involved in polysaccharide export with SLBB domain